MSNPEISAPPRSACERPAWMEQALSNRPRRSRIVCSGRSLEVLEWGRSDAPGLLFLHGNGAHADWWAFTAPFFAQDWHCVALSFSGMGGSSHAAGCYDNASRAQEILAAIPLCGPANGPVTIVAHSAGGYPAMVAAALTNRIAAIVSIDSAIVPRSHDAKLPRPSVRPSRVYPGIEDAVSRFRFIPEAVEPDPAAVDYVARTSLVPAVDPETGSPGWTWSFDPALYGQINNAGLAVLPARAGCPLALLIGGRSDLLDSEVVDHMRALYPAGSPFITIPEAGHHIMVERPLELVAALRALLSVWPAMQHGSA